MVFIASLDVGTTSVRCFIFDSQCEIKGSSAEFVELLNPKPGYFEIEPEKLWRSCLNVISNAIKDAKLSPSDITCLGISTQRCSFVVWDKNSQEYFHNFITWKDLRADSLVTQWNSGMLLKSLNAVSYCLYLVSRKKRFLAGSVLKMMNGQVTLRLLHEISHNTRLKDAIARKTAVFGTLDSWLLYKLRQGNTRDSVEHISDITSSTATGLFDPFTLAWSSMVSSIFKIRPEILPKVVDNSFEFGNVHSSLFGHPIKIGSSVSDQTASMLGSCCFEEADVKVTLGTGSFLNLATGKKCHASVMGLYPLVAWRFRDELGADDLMYCVEGAANDTGTLITWAQSFGLFDHPSQSSDIAASVPDSDGVYFVPAFSGIGPPVNDYKAATGFLGLRPHTSKAHLVRAILESIVFRIAQLCRCTQVETDYKLTCLRVDGGVSKNDFICQTLADVTGLKVERAVNSESSVLGAAFAAGLNQKVWKSKRDLKEFRKIDRVFEPRAELTGKLRTRMGVWEKAIGRFKGWYETS